MIGAIFGSSQLKWLCRDRLYIDGRVDVCTFSFAGATVLSLRERIEVMSIKKLDFAVVYVGGNDVQNGDKGSALVVEVVVSKNQHDFTSAYKCTAII